MDPLTAFSLACGVIQVVDFSTKAVTLCAQLYRDGTLAQYKDLEETAKQLSDLRTALKLSAAGQSTKLNQIPSETLLTKIATDCSDNAELLVIRLRAFKIAGSHRKRQVIRKTFKALREKREIQEIQNRLDSYRRALDSQILVNLRFVEIPL